MQSPRQFPDASYCTTRHVHGPTYKCLAEDGGRCPHSFAFAYSFYCRHPDARRFKVKATWDLAA